MKYPDITLGRVEAVWNKLGGEEGVEKLLRGALTVSEGPRSWYEKDGVIYFKVVSDGTTGEEWVRRLENKGTRLGLTKGVLRSPDFKPTSGVTTEIAVLKGMLFEDNDRITGKIRAEADKRKLQKPNAEIACLIREKFTDKDIKAMGLSWIVVMHEPIKDSEPYQRFRLLLVSRDDGGRSIGTYWAGDDYDWRHHRGFAFTVSQVGPQS